MGGSLSNPFRSYLPWSSSPPTARILVRPRLRVSSCPAQPNLLDQFVGLDAAGKTSMLYKLNLGDIKTPNSTLGFHVETLESDNVSFTTWDVGGRMRMRPLWRHYFPQMNAIVFMIDSNDRERISEATEELSKMLNEDDLRERPLLVMCNKQDLPNAMSVAEVTEKMGLHALRGRQWFIQACCATTGDGIVEGLRWLSRAISNAPSVQKPLPPAPAARPVQGVAKA